MGCARLVPPSVRGDGYELIKERKNGEEEKYIRFSENEKG